MIDNLDYWENSLRNSQKTLADYRKFKETIQQAVDDFSDKKYAHLDKAIEKYGSFEEIRTAYGYGWITKARFDKLDTLRAEKEEDRTHDLLAPMIKYINERIGAVEKVVQFEQSRIKEIKQRGGVTTTND